MAKLIKSDLQLTLKHPIFIFGMFLTLAVNLYYIFSDRSGGSIMRVFTPFCAVFFLPLGMCVLTVFTCGTDLSSRTISRKLSIGYTKKEIYLSHLISSLVAAFFLTLPCFVSIIIPVYLAKLNFGVFFVYYIYSLLAIFAMTAIIVFLTAIINIKSVAFVMSFILCSSSILMFINFGGRVEAPEYLITYNTIETPITDEDGNSYIMQEYIGEQVKVKNPEYITGMKRRIYSAIAYFSPGCFLYHMSSKNLNYAELGYDDVREQFESVFRSNMTGFFKSVPFSLCVFALFSFFGVQLFKKKDLN